MPGRLPITTDQYTVPTVRVTGGTVDFDYIQSDDMQFGDRGVPIGRYMTAAGNVISVAIAAARTANPSKRKFLLPPGEWPMSLITQASGVLGSNLIFDGQDRDRCILYRDTAGGMMLWTSATNVAVQNVTFDLRNMSNPFSSSLNAIGSTNFLVQDCAFLCSIPDTVTNDGIRHQVLFSGSNIVVRRCYFKSTQLKMCSTGVSVDQAIAYLNDFEDCNDLGISVVAGDGSSDYVKRVRIFKNRFYGILKGSGYIYVGSDAATTNPTAMSDVDIFDNECTGTIGQLGTDNASRPASRTGIYVVLCDVNKRLRIRGNTITNSNPAYSSPLCVGAGVFLRLGSSTSTNDVLVEGNSIDFQTDDTRGAVFIDGPNMTDVKVKRNTVQSGSRGLIVGSCSHSDISENVMHGSVSTGLLVNSTANAINDLRIHHNDLESTQAFAATIQFSGSHSMSRVTVENNRLISSASGNAGIHNLSGGSTLDIRSNHNSMNHAYSANVTASLAAAAIGDRVE